MPSTHEVPAQSPKPGTEYLVVPLEGSRRNTAPQWEQATQTLNEYAAQGWRLVSVDQLLAYLERPARG